MKSSTAPFKAPAMRRTQLSVPFDEMRRLMRVYGSTKCLRKRQSSRGDGNMKDESVKRKFYRWFPDLEERFAKDSAGYWRPRFGHEFEMRYRDELRRRDGEVTSKKRATAKMRTEDRRRRLGGAGAPAPAATAEGSGAERPAAPFVASASGGDDRDFERAGTVSVSGHEAASTVEGCYPVPAAPPPVAQPRFDREWTTMDGADASITEDDEALYISARNMASTATVWNPVIPASRLFAQPRWSQEATDQESARPEDADDANAASPLFADDGPLDGSFVAERGIFDDVERSFYGGTCPPGLASSSSCGSASSGGDAPPPPSADGMLDGSMAEYCEEVLASGGQEGASVFRFDGL